MQPITNLSSIISPYKAVLLDLWGVVHDGTELYPGVREALLALKKHNIRVLFLSNAPRRAAKAKLVLDRLGVDKALYEGLVTSGEIGFEWLSGYPLGKRYFFIGPPRDADVLNGLEYKVSSLEAADFILNVGYGSEEQSADAWDETLERAADHELPMVCPNPDKEVVTLAGGRFPCAGVIAESYAQIGGTVHWFGKPYAAVYDHCLQKLKPLKKSEILAIGDGLGTDIKGAKKNGIAAALVTGGILAGEVPKDLGANAPDFVMPRLQW